MLKCVSHVSFLVSDMEKSLQFYCNVLGMKKAFEVNDDDNNPWLIYLKVCEGQFIELFYGGSPKSASGNDISEDAFKATQKISDPTSNIKAGNPSGYVHLCLEVDNIFDIAATLKKEGITLDIELKMGKDLNYQCWASDPDGNKIEFMQISPKSPQRNC